jgi:hypothetical protein
LRFYWLTLGTLAVFRLTHLLVAEDGPARILDRFRRRAGGWGLGGLVECFYCSSLWVAAPFAWWIGEGAWERGLLWLALSAGAIVVERVTGAAREAAPVAPAVYREDPEEGNDGLLRRP